MEEFPVPFFIEGKVGSQAFGSPLFIVGSVVSAAGCLLA